MNSTYLKRHEAWMIATEALNEKQNEISKYVAEELVKCFAAIKQSADKGEFQLTYTATFLDEYTKDVIEKLISILVQQCDYTVKGYGTNGSRTIMISWD
jgi:hypothetical protein